MFRKLKSEFLKIFHHIRYAASYFALMNLLLASLYFFILSESPTFCYDRFETLVHTFTATLTMSVPVFIEAKEFYTNGYCLDLLVLSHMFLAYLFLGALISLVYRKLTRT